jgi:hypothetical protein
MLAGRCAGVGRHATLPRSAARQVPLAATPPLGAENHLFKEADHGY